MRRDIVLLQVRLVAVTVGLVALGTASLAVVASALFVYYLLLVGTVVVTGIALSYVMSDWTLSVDLDFDSPINLRSALTFGGLFLVVVLVSAGAQSAYGASGLLVSSFLSGLVSSGAVTTSAVLLVQSGAVSTELASLAIIAGVTGSILVKLGLVVSMNRALTKPVAIATSVLVTAGALVSGGLFLFG